MRLGGRCHIRVAIAGLVEAMVMLEAGPARLHAAAIEEPAPAQSPARTAGVSDAEELEDYVRLEVRENDLLLTNISDHPINAWSVKHVVRSSQGYEAYTTLGVDAFLSPMHPGGQEKLLLPGESISLEKAAEPWIREDHRGPGSAVFYEVGALAFEGGEAIGDPEIVDHIFERRLDLARTALKALEVTAAVEAGEKSELDELPPHYRGNLDFFATREEAVGAIHSQALEDYMQTVANLRPQDLTELPSPEELLP